MQGTEVKELPTRFFLQVQGNSNRLFYVDIFYYVNIIFERKFLLNFLLKSLFYPLKIYCMFVILCTCNW